MKHNGNTTENAPVSGITQPPSSPQGVLCLHHALVLTSWDMPALQNRRRGPVGGEHGQSSPVNNRGHWGRSCIWTRWFSQFSRSVVSDSLRRHGLQHARSPCPSPTPGTCVNLGPSSRWCHPTISSSVIHPLLLPSIFPSIRVFSNQSVLHITWPKYWSFSFSINPSNEHSGLIFFRMDWLDLLAVQGTLKNLLQHHSSKASIFRCSAFFIVQRSHPYMTTGKTIALTRQSYVSKVMSLLFNRLL